MTFRQADKAIKSGRPIAVQPARGERFTIVLTSRSKRIAYGNYAIESDTTREGAFEYADLALVA